MCSGHVKPLAAEVKALFSEVSFEDLMFITGFFPLKLVRSF
jgi:hypothetical protein